MAGVRRGAFTCVGWQVILCDPVWQVTSRSSEVGFSPGRAMSAFTFYFPRTRGSCQLVANMFCLRQLVTDLLRENVCNGFLPLLRCVASALYVSCELSASDEQSIRSALCETQNDRYSPNSRPTASICCRPIHISTLSQSRHFVESRD